MHVLINLRSQQRRKYCKLFQQFAGDTAKNNLDEEENIIMNGDFNCPLNPSTDKKGGLLNPRKAVISTIGNLPEERDLVDIYGGSKILRKKASHGVKTRS